MTGGVSARRGPTSCLALILERLPPAALTHHLWGQFNCG